MNRRTLFPAAVALWSAAAAADAAPVRRPRPDAIRTADGTPLAFTDWGQGRPIVFVHAWALSGRMWEVQVAALAQQGFRCITFDRRGHGRTPDPGRGYELDTLAEDLATVMDQLDLKDVTLVGHSMGAAEALHYLARRGQDRVRRLVLLAPATPCLTLKADNPQGFPAVAFEQIRAAWVRDFPKWVADNTPAFYTPETSAEAMAHGARMMLATPLPVAIACNRVLTDADVRPDCARVTIPTLVIHGDADASAPLDLTGRRTAALIRGARLEVLPGAPHGLFTTHAEPVNQAIGAFARA